ncbi:MAG: 5'-methylthioadenosine/adenosylhomocysteine nucleosidase [Proteocatella sp.]
MVIGIIGAMAEEVESLKNVMTIEEKMTKASMDFYEGNLWGHDVVVVVSGIGKVNAAICAQILVDIFDVDKIINVGVAGGVSLDANPGDIVIASSLVQHDMDCSAFGDKPGQIPRMDVFDFKCDENLVDIARNIKLSNADHKSMVGIIATGDQFVADNVKVKWIQDTFNAAAVEMEGGSIAQVAHQNKVPFIVIRSISDNANTGAHVDFAKFVPVAVENSMVFIKGLLENLK